MPKWKQNLSTKERERETDSFLEHVKVVNDDTDEEVESEEGSAHDEDDEIEIRPQVGLVRRLQIDAAHVHSVRHNLHPAFKRRL